MKKDLSRYEHLTYSEIEYLIDQHVILHRNCKRNREILKRSLLDGISYERIAEEFELTPRQVSNIVYTTEQILFKHL